LNYVTIKTFMVSKTKQTQIINLSKRLIAIESTEYNIKEQEFCLSILEEAFKDKFYAKWYSFRGHPALILSTTKKKSVDIIFSGHIDVVSGDKKLFKPVLKDSKLFGRGAYDMKAGVVACAYALSDYKKMGGEKDVALMVTSDEEISGYSTQMLLGKYNYRSKFTLILDGGSENSIVLRQKGFMKIRVVFVGKSAHAAYPWEGVSALTEIINLQKLIDKKYPLPLENNQWKTSIVLTKVQTNNSTNQIPEFVEAYFDVRFIDKKDPKKIIDIMKNFINPLGSVEIIAENGIFISSEKNHYIKKLAKVLYEKTKNNVVFISENGTSDAVFFSDKNIPVALLRPKGGGQHQDSEWVDTDSLYETYENLVNFLKQV
jgi:acetylornithine deacetylase/succinyl-diaminopimelate desuccinylase-like protein